MTEPSDLLNDFMEPATGYWRALGMFIHQFSRTERLLLSLVKEIAGVPSPIAHAAFSGLRVAQATDALKRVLEALNDKGTASRLEAPLRQLGEITTTRNSVVHWGAYAWEGEGLLATNSHEAISAAKVRGVVLSVAALEDMTADLLKIERHLLIEIPMVNKPDFADYRASLENSLARAWRYKPSRLSGPVTETRGRFQAREAPPPASPK